MSVEPISKEAAPTSQTSAAGTRFPAYDLATCIEVPRAIHVKGGGQATADQLAAHLGYKGTNNGAYLSKVGAARAFGLISKSGAVYVPTPLAHQILSPVYPHDAKKALVDAFLNVPLFKKIYDDFRGKELPPEFGMKNALRNQYAVAANRLSDAHKVLLDSADTAGFFSTKGGARTHLILPLVQPVQNGTPPPPPPGDAEFGGGGGGAGGGGGGGTGGGMGNPPPPAGNGAPFRIEEVKAKYLSALIKLFEEKSAKGELDEKLMERIERLLGEGGSGGN